MSLTKIAIAGVSSEVGKTTLLCQLLREFPDWEAIKMTRGHYRSCGKDPHACCVSHLLGDEPLIRSGFQQTYASDKDTGRYWDAGAANVHWVVVTDDQVERGIELALERVNAPGVLIEGNSFLRFIDVDFVALVTGGANTKIKSSARWAFQKASVVYLLDQTAEISPSESVEILERKFGSADVKRFLPALGASDFPGLVERIARVHANATNGPDVPVGLESGLVRQAGGAQLLFLNDRESVYPGRSHSDVSTVRRMQGERS